MSWKRMHKGAPCSMATASRTVIFDLDGTLVNSLPFVLRSLSHAVEPYTDLPLTMEVFGKLGGPPSRFFHEWIEDPADVRSAVGRLEAFTEAHGHEIEAFPGACDTLRGLRDASVSLAVWTGRDRESTLRVLDHTGLAGFFSEVVCGDDFPTHKPHPQGMLAILGRLGSLAGLALFLGDADVDVEAGHACGVSTILIQNGRTVPATVLGKAWRVVPAPDEGYRLALRWAEGGRVPATGPLRTAAPCEDVAAGAGAAAGTVHG